MHQTKISKIILDAIGNSSRAFVVWILVLIPIAWSTKNIWQNIFLANKSTVLICTLLSALILYLILLVSTVSIYVRDTENKVRIELQRRTEQLDASFRAKEYVLEKRGEELSKMERSLVQERQSFSAELRSTYEKMEAQRVDYNQRVSDIKQIMREREQRYPWLALLFADYIHTQDAFFGQSLLHKSRPAIRAAEEVARIAKEKRKLQQLCKEYEYQLNYYESLFPWLEDFKELTPGEGYNAFVTDDTNQVDEYQIVKEWLSPDEYKNLPSATKWQRALDRYVNRKKTNWHIGIEYERYVGYRYEMDGYKVRYEGALKGLEDRGRDIIAFKGTDFVVIQCKRWSQEKTIHEKHIAQLFGSVAVLNMQTSNKSYRGVFVTTTSLSDVATEFTRLLNIEVVEHFIPESYPLIKCHNTSSAEKIYHLPFDLQYDRTQLNLNDGDLYAATTEDAEANGFRHAFRWSGSNSQ